MGNPLAQLLAMLQGSPMSQLPAERQGVGPGFGLAGSNIAPSDLMDQLRNADRKEAALPTQKSFYARVLQDEALARKLADLAGDTRMAKGLAAEEKALASAKYNPARDAKPMSASEIAEWEARNADFLRWLRNAQR